MLLLRDFGHNWFDSYVAGWLHRLVLVLLQQTTMHCWHWLVNIVCCVECDLLFFAKWEHCCWATIVSADNQCNVNWKKCGEWSVADVLRFVLCLSFWSWCAADCYPSTKGMCVVVVNRLLFNKCNVYVHLWIFSARGPFNSHCHFASCVTVQELS